MPNSFLESISNPADVQSRPVAGTADVRETRTLKSTVLELRVRNHPGTMSHVTGLFARRAFNLDAITCAPVGDGTFSLMRLLVTEEPRLEQVERQLEKLHDVLSVRHRPDLGPAYFAVLGEA